MGRKRIGGHVGRPTQYRDAASCRSRAGLMLKCQVTMAMSRPSDERNRFADFVRRFLSDGNLPIVDALPSRGREQAARQLVRDWAGCAGCIDLRFGHS
jgi:hypothetical protein